MLGSNDLAKPNKELALFFSVPNCKSITKSSKLTACSENSGYCLNTWLITLLAKGS